MDVLIFFGFVAVVVVLMIVIIVQGEVVLEYKERLRIESDRCSALRRKAYALEKKKTRKSTTRKEAN